MRARSPTTLVVAPEPLGPSASGPARRAAKLAAAVGPHCPVTLAAPDSSTFPAGPFRTVTTGPPERQRLSTLLAEHDVAVVQALPSPRQLVAAIRHARHLVVDLIAPLAFEVAPGTHQGSERRDPRAAWRVRQLVDHLRAADLVLCTNERQRDLYLGAASAAEAAIPDPDRFAVVPHGIDAEPPGPGRRPLREAGMVAPGDQLAVWGGGLWDWLDPITPIRAVEHLRGRRPELRLVFVGTGRDGGPGARMRERAVALARERGLEGDAVVFVHGWLDRSHYLDHLLEADVGVCAHPLTLEARYATRTRLLDYLWAGLRTVSTSGEAMGDFAQAAGLGATAPAGDVDAFAAALDAQLDAGRLAESERGALDPLRWTNAARPLVEYCRTPMHRRAGPRVATAVRATTHYRSFLAALHRDAGAGGVARAAARRLRR